MLMPYRAEMWDWASCEMDWLESVRVTLYLISIILVYEEVKVMEQFSGRAVDRSQLTDSQFLLPSSPCLSLSHQTAQETLISK